MHANDICKDQKKGLEKKALPERAWNTTHWWRTHDTIVCPSERGGTRRTDDAHMTPSLINTNGPNFHVHTHVYLLTNQTNLTQQFAFEEKHNDVIKTCCNSRFERYRWIQVYSTAPIVISLSHYCSTIILFCQDGNIRVYDARGIQEQKLYWVQCKTTQHVNRSISMLLQRLICRRHNKKYLSIKAKSPTLNLYTQ